MASLYIESLFTNIVMEEIIEKSTHKLILTAEKKRNFKR